MDDQLAKSDKRNVSDHVKNAIESDIIVLMYDFVYSLAVHRTIHSRSRDSYNLNNIHERFWNTVSDNCIQQGVVDWCKVFGSEKERTHYSKMHSSYTVDFEIAVAEEKIDLFEYSNAMRNFRDKFISHRDEPEKRKPIPCLDQALIICDLFEKIVLFGESIILPFEMIDFYQQSKKEISEYLDQLGIVAI